MITVVYTTLLKSYSNLKGEDKMEMSVKERVHQALKAKNHFDCGKKDSLEVFEKALNLEDVLIRVERNCNVDQPLFRYNPDTHMFCRVTLSEEDKELMRKELQYRVLPECKRRKCFSQEIDVDSFIALLEFVFEPIAVYSLI